MSRKAVLLLQRMRQWTS